MMILSADIGGTNSRFALFEAGPLRLKGYEIVPSKAKSFAEVLGKLTELRPDMAPEHSDIFVLAVAGPVTGQRGVQPSNLPYYIDIGASREARMLGASLLINDFSAQAWACLTPAMREATILPPVGASLAPGTSFVFPPVRPELQGQPCALIGAGTGLGMAVLTADGPQAEQAWRGVRVMPSEGGHAVFPFVGKEEQEFAAFAGAIKKLDYLRLDDIVTGPGLSLLHRFLTGQEMEPSNITAEPGFSSSRSCELFARFYGRACRNLALTCLPGAGLVVTGGLAANCPDLVRHEAFRRELDNAPGEHRNLLRQIPFWHNGNQLSGLWGAAMAGWAALVG